MKKQEITKSVNDLFCPTYTCCHCCNAIPVYNLSSKFEYQCKENSEYIRWDHKSCNKLKILPWVGRYE
mgnify:CR=1 FL=1